MSKLDDILNPQQTTTPAFKKQQIKELMLEIVDETAFAYKDGLDYAKVVRKKVEEL